jgi:hypothetical protein
VNTYGSIGDTNLTTGTLYYIKEKSGKYLRWDGNYGTHNNGGDKKGLYFDQELRIDYKKHWYLFDLSNFFLEDDEIVIRNVKLKSNLYWNNKFVRKPFICLSQISWILDEMKFKILKTNNENWFNIQTSNKSYLSFNDQYSFEDDKYYSIGCTFNESERAEVMFIKAEEQSINDNNYVLGTNLTTNTYYCIQTLNVKNETQFLKWDGIEYENYSGIILNKTYDNKCPNSKEYFFEIEYYGGTGVIMKNIESNKYISVLKDFTFALINYKIEGYIDFRLNLIVSTTDEFITIRGRNVLDDFKASVYYVYLGNSSGNTYHNRIDGVNNYSDSLNFTFIRIRASDPPTTTTTVKIETTTKSNAHNFIHGSKFIVILNIIMIFKIFYFIIL